jgi:hypothetical protein
MNALKISAVAREGVATITGHQPELVSRCEPCEGGWQVHVELVDTKARITENDIMATYQLNFDAHGELLSYERTRRYPRGKNGGTFAA